MPILTAKERIGTEIGGRYNLIKILGEGGFSSVFLAEHTLTGRRVALKILHAHLVQEEQIAQRFLLEAQAMAKLRHTGITQVLDAGREADGTVFMALELLEGETLEARLTRVGRLPRQETAKIVLEVLGALSVAHAAQIVHRDIKPANIFLAHEHDGTQHAKVLDFGIAHVVPKSGDKLTSKGVILGTPEYMSPEQGRGLSIGPEADLWSVGILMYEMFSGVVPWTHESSTAVLIAVASAKLPDIRQFAPDLAEPFVEIVEHALQKEPRDRYPSAEAMRKAVVEAVRTVEGKTSAELRAVMPPVLPGDAKHAVTPEPVMPTPSAEMRAPMRDAQSTGPRPSMMPKPIREIELDAGDDASLEIDPTAEAMLRAPLRAPSLTNIPAVSMPPRREGADATAQRQKLADSSPKLDANTTAQRSAMARGSLRTAADVTGRHDSPLAQPAISLDAGTTAPRTSMRAPPGASMRPGRVPSVRPPPASSSSMGSDLDLPLPPAPDDLPLPRPPRMPASGSLGAISGDVPRVSRVPSMSPPPISRTPSPAARSNRIYAVIVPVALGVAAIGAFALYRLRPTSENNTSTAPRAHEDGGLAHPDAAVAPRETAHGTLEQRIAIAVPYTAHGEAIHAFARHAVYGQRHGNALRPLFTCAGENVYVYGAGDGLPTGSGTAPIACEMLDIAAVSDVDGDGDDDVAAVSASHDALVILATRQFTVRSTFPVPGLYALGGTIQLHGDSVVIGYTQPRGPAGATQLVAISARSGNVLWRASGSAPLEKFGHPADVGLAVGPDANGDGIDDVVAGVGALPSLATDQMPARPRCVVLLSGADGTPIWHEPFCQLRGGSQSVSLGPDVDGDHLADIAIGTDQTRGADARVVLVSGHDGHLLRRIAPPAGPAGPGFGWPVVLGPDLDGDHVGDVAVGSVGAGGAHVTIVSGATGAAMADTVARGETGFPNLRLAIADGILHGDAPGILIGAPDDGLHVFNLSTTPGP